MRWAWSSSKVMWGMILPPNQLRGKIRTKEINYYTYYGTESKGKVLFPPLHSLTKQQTWRTQKSTSLIHGPQGGLWWFYKHTHPSWLLSQEVLWAVQKTAVPDIFWAQTICWWSWTRNSPSSVLCKGLYSALLLGISEWGCRPDFPEKGSFSSESTSLLFLCRPLAPRHRQAEQGTQKNLLIATGWMNFWRSDLTG